MDSPKSDAQGHTRTRSGARSTRPRASTKGPLDVDDNPPSTPALTPTTLLPSRPGQTHTQTTLHSPLIRSAASPSPSRQPLRPQQQRDLAHLLRPELYHPVPTTAIPAPFRAATSKQPDPTTTPIPDLLAGGHYRAAAAAAAQALVAQADSGSAPRPSEVLDLLHARLASLTQAGDGGLALAAQEMRTLPPEVVDEGGVGVGAAPWDLRVLAVRLRALGFGDGRRAVTSYHELAREARAAVGRALRRGDRAEAEVWRERLDEVGVRVAGALVEMDDLVGAAELLRGGLRGVGSCGGRLAVARALLWLQMGDVEGARACVDGEEVGGKAKGVVEALCAMADGEYEAALRMWLALRAEEEEDEGGSRDEMVGVNTAVCLLYVGRMQEGRALLESLVDAGFSSHTLLFNLTTMYELCTERPRPLKMQLAEKVAAMDETPNGWEKTNADFKL